MWITDQDLATVVLVQLCPTRGPVEGFVGPSWVFAVVKVPRTLTTCPCFDNFEFDIFMQVVLSATLSRLLPFQLGFEHFQYISIS